MMYDAWKTDSSTNQTYFDVVGKILYDQLLVLPSRERKSPLFLGYPAHTVYKIRVHMPEPWSVPADEWKVERDAYSIHFKSEFIPVENVWQLTYTYKTKQDFVAAESAGQYKADIDKLVKNLEYRLDASEHYQLGWNNVNGWMLILALLVLVACFWGYRSLQTYSPGEPTHREPLKIRGILIFVALNIYLLPVALPFLYFSQEDGKSFSWSAWNHLGEVSDSLLWGYHALLVIDTIAYTAIWSFWVFLAWLFYKKRDSFPSLYSNFLGVCLVFEIVNTTFLYTFFLDTSSPTFDFAIKDALREVFAAAIWITYMHKSSRVKRTFLNTYADQIGAKHKEESEILENQ
jgi:hypothetical protein